MKSKGAVKKRFRMTKSGKLKCSRPKRGHQHAVKDAKAKLAPSALWWFRWGAMFTFITGLVLLGYVHANGQLNGYIIMGALLATIMFLNVWLVIWPNQKIALGIVPGGDAAAAGAKAALASRHNVLFSGPMALGMLAGPHFIGGAGYGLAQPTLGWWLPIALVLALEANALFGKQGPLTSVKGVIHCSLGLTAVIIVLLELLK